MRMLVGLVIGMALGSGGTYVAMTKFAHKAAKPPDVADAGTVDEVPKKKKRSRRKRGRRGGIDGTGELQVIDERVQLTAADRVMVWKGPPVRLPPDDVDFGNSGQSRSLNEDEINQGITSGQKAIVGCIADARGQAELVADITVKLLVENGRVGPVRVHAPSYLMKNGLYGCVTRAARRMDFPSTGKATVVTIPLSLGI